MRDVGLAKEDVLLALAAMCQIERVPFDASLVLREFPPLYSLETLLHAAGRLGFEAATREAAAPIPTPAPRRHRCPLSLVRARAAQAQAHLARRARRVGRDPAACAGDAALHAGRHRQGRRSPDGQHGGRHRRRARGRHAVQHCHELGAAIPRTAYRQPGRRRARHARLRASRRAARPATSSTGRPARSSRGCTASRRFASSSAARR